MFQSLKWQSTTYQPLLSEQVLEMPIADGISESETPLSNISLSEHLKKNTSRITKSSVSSSSDQQNTENNCERECSIQVEHVEQLELPHKLVLLLHNVLLKDECQLMIELSEKMGYEDADSYCFAYNDRFNDRLMVDDQNLTDLIWNRMKDHLPQVIAGMKLKGLNSRWRLCKYKPGHYFGVHTDGSYQDRKTNSVSCLTFMIYLNSQLEGAYKGGATIFFDRKRGEKARIVQPSGTAIVFLQEDMDMLHCGQKVESGVKYILRTDVMYSIVHSTNN
ncbi:hypothetical protein FDP41_013739 [Naegleria fowleri]|uniref:Fe2OG dioxygenase domain-containing protein n=1 Tax=Naegleria fowleri TaxID=5763 RepID=A0A6A5C4X2_NAEFO|nr:uncharacterized protein FDP41_013739 [Naegleria fowleri]KAF0980525.1 hypothetical protein FDP41_013739 [Naegleria fowleri]CAG4708225.1 unnamed protein product [Naegleria fowleri]